MHKINGKQEAGQSCRRSIPCHFFPQQVDKRQHGNAEQSTHDTPAERIHSKDGNTQGDEDLAQRRVGIFVGRQAVKELVSRACVIDFIEIHAVAEGIAFRVQIAFVKQCRVGICVQRACDVAIRVQEDQFNQRGIIIRQ